MKRLLSSAIITTMLATSVVVPPALAAETSTNQRLIDNIRIHYNASIVNTTQPAVLEDGRISLALRDFFEGINVPVTWSTDDRSATVTTENKLIVIYPDTGKITINDKEMLLDASPQMVGYRVYVPLRFLSEQLGYQVNYAIEEGTHVIRIVGDSPELLKLHDGAVTRIKNRTLAVAEPENAQESANFVQWKANNARYFLDSNGDLNEVVSTGSSIEVRHINAAQAKVETATYTTPTPFAFFGKIVAAGRNGYDLAINPSTDNRYVGIGTPTNTSPLEIFDTNIGRLLLYSSSANDTVLNIDNTSGAISGTYNDPVRGYVLDTIELSTQVEESSYAIADNGNYGFLINGFLLIVDPNKQEIVFSELLSNDLTNSQIFSMGDQFIVNGVENSRYAANVGYYTAVFKTTGERSHFYSNMTAKTKIDDLGYMTPLDSFVEGKTLYTLLKTQWDHYLAVYDVANDVFTMTELPYNYTTFIPTPTGKALFMKDTAYFYIQPVQ